jgi:hypothetical protein
MSWVCFLVLCCPSTKLTRPVGIFNLHRVDLAKADLRERYYHTVATTPDDGVIIITTYTQLLLLLDDPTVLSFEGDTTFSRIGGELNEWELVIYLKKLQRGSLCTFAFVLALI